MIETAKRKPPASETPGSRGVQPRWLSVKEAGQYMCISEEAVRMMLRRGRLPFVQAGRRIFIDRDDIDKYMGSRKTRAV